MTESINICIEFDSKNMKANNPEIWINAKIFKFKLPYFFKARKQKVLKGS